jgi:hypothetical protein
MNRAVSCTTLSIALLLYLQEFCWKGLDETGNPRKGDLMVFRTPQRCAVFRSGDHGGLFHACERFDLGNLIGDRN